MENGHSEIPENANERTLILLGLSLKNMKGFLFFIIRFSFCFLRDCVIFFGGLFLDCPGPQSESAGKSDECEGCPNQEACATAPKGPDPGSDSLPLNVIWSVSWSCFKDYQENSTGVTLFFLIYLFFFRNDCWFHGKLGKPMK